MVTMRLVPEDDYMHSVEDVSNFNESAYYNFYDQASEFGGWVRLGNRVNEGYAEMTTCLYLPDGRVAFWFARPHIDNNDAHDAGGLRFEVLRPFEEHRVTYDGPVVLLEDPSEMEDPKAAFTNNPHADAHLDLSLTGVGRVWGGEPVNDDGTPITQDAEKAFARGHTEQHMGITGSATVGDDGFVLEDALGLRDHSWGPRYWQNIWWYRWLTVNLGPDLGFACTYSGDESGRSGANGFLYDGEDAEWTRITGVELHTDYDDHWYQKSLRAVVRTADDREYEVEGTVKSLIPLRNRRSGMMTRITEGMTIWRSGDKVGAGLSEYLDQIKDGKPVGV